MIQLATWCDLVSLRHSIEASFIHGNSLNESTKKKSKDETILHNCDDFRSSLRSIAQTIIRRMKVEEVYDALCEDQSETGVDIIGTRLLKTQQEFQRDYKGNLMS